MNYKTSNAQTADSKNSKNNADQGSTQSGKFTARKSDSNNKAVFEKEFSDVNQAVTECCRCDSADKSAKAPQFENTPEGAKKASQWLSNNNGKYNFDISASNDQGQRRNEAGSNMNQSSENRDDLTKNSSANGNAKTNQKEYDKSEVNS